MALNGIRTGAGLWQGDRKGLEKAIAQSLRENMHLVSNPRNLDSSVDEVFHMMLGAVCSPIDEMPLEETETITAVVGFGGLLSGACVFRSGSSAALDIAG